MIDNLRPPPTMPVTFLARLSVNDRHELEGSDSQTSQWERRHDNGAAVNYMTPDMDTISEELRLVDSWFTRVTGYKA